MTDAIIGLSMAALLLTLLWMFRRRRCGHEALITKILHDHRATLRENQRLERQLEETLP